MELPEYYITQPTIPQAFQNYPLDALVTMNHISKHRQMIAALYEEEIRRLQQILTEEVRIKQQVEMAAAPTITQQRSIWEKNQQKELDAFDIKQQQHSTKINHFQLLLASVRKSLSSSEQEQHLQILKSMFERFYESSKTKSKRLIKGYSLNRPDATFPEPINSWFKCAASILLPSPESLKPTLPEQTSLNLLGIRLSVVDCPF